MQISAIIAAKEEAPTIRRVVEQVKKYVSECIVVTPPDDFETQSALDGVECKILTEQKPGKGNAIVWTFSAIYKKLIRVFGKHAG